ncbi:MAG TPA: translation elongation factor Ts [Oligoflexia bacterium]|nr:translation elongation factor Ts [Oligoflexia bacterium]HMP27800.1 translation elongation factor Ts [Oligoflexia bacterium]
MSENISAEAVKKLRDMTGAGMMDCKSALAEAKGNFDLAVEILRKKGLKNVGKRAGKVAAEGTLGVYVHPGDQIVAVVELNSETDFVARGEEFKQLAKDIAMQVAAMRPKYLSIEDIPAEVIEKEKEIILEQLGAAAKDKADKILPGKLAAFYGENVLLEQPYVKDEKGSQKVVDLINNLSAKLGEKITLRRFTCLVVGEGIEKAASNFAEEVAATIAG